MDTRPYFRVSFRHSFRKVSENWAWGRGYSSPGSPWVWLDCVGGGPAGRYAIRSRRVWVGYKIRTDGPDLRQLLKSGPLYCIVANRPGLAGTVPGKWLLSRRCPGKTIVPDCPGILALGSFLGLNKRFLLCHKRFHFCSRLC